jgi:hypothetical protein
MFFDSTHILGLSIADMDTSLPCLGKSVHWITHLQVVFSIYTSLYDTIWLSINKVLIKNIFSLIEFCAIDTYYVNE